LEDRISKRYYLLSNLESIIQESVYYRSFSEDMKTDKKVVYSFGEDSGEVEIK